MVVVSIFTEQCLCQECLVPNVFLALQGTCQLAAILLYPPLPFPAALQGMVWLSVLQLWCAKTRTLPLKHNPGPWVF